jgi:hypothetical protein
MDDFLVGGSFEIWQHCELGVGIFVFVLFFWLFFDWVSLGGMNDRYPSFFILSNAK